MPSTRSVKLEWEHDGLRFRGAGTSPATPAIQIDGDNRSAPGPMLVLLLAAASCTASDIVLIFEKMRVTLGRMEVEVTGTRKEDDPKRYTAVHFRYTFAGEGLDEAKAERAVSLSLDKYCSVVHSLAKDIAISHDIVLA